MTHDTLRAEYASALAAPPGDVSPARIADLKRQLDAIVYPVAHLPTEITQSIFERLVTPPPDVTNDRWWIAPAVELTPTTAPMLLMQVCASWRAIALQLPALWAAVKITFRGPDRGPPVGEELDTWLTVACPTPRVLTLAGTVVGRERAHAEAVLKKHAGGVTHLRLSLELESLGLLQWSFPMPVLRRAYVTLAQDFGVGVFTSDDFVQLFRDTPALHDITVHGNIRRGSFALPWGQLTAVNSDSWSAADCLAVLQACPRLEKATFTDVFESPMPPPAGPIRPAALAVLQCTPFLPQLCDFLQPPNLTFLVTSHAPKPPRHGRFPAFLAPFSHTLTTFDYAAHYHSDADPLAVTWFDPLVALEKLQLIRPPEAFTRAFLLRLDRATHPQFLPRLRQLVIRKQQLFIDLAVIKAAWTRCPCIPYDDFFLPENAEAAEPTSPAPEPAPAPDPPLPTLDALVFIHHPFPRSAAYPGLGGPDAVGDVDWDALADLLWATEDAEGRPKMAVHVGTERENFVVPWDPEGREMKKTRPGDPKLDS
ncbi:F-box domain-containing protein [Mycena indigotica]|uniref:F-box domain-containing protein n=1 Tax=Mycena indigotica TaxID=2126181 RepID=A0A8H6VYZ6_9AGAR|nr:F-box domain-containing protein [Mycena indigotica]KAF7297016.1 F-box domain-containing protein [Mycena indigotica]